MKVLHISDYGLPDARIERAAKTDMKMGHEVYFCGPLAAGGSSKHEIFSMTYSLEWTTQARLKIPLAWIRLKKHFNRILSELRPELIHAHNVCAAKLASESRYPFVFDDHEHISLELKAIAESEGVPGSKRYFSKPLTGKIWARWENELAQSAPIITVGSNIAQDYQALGGKAFVVPNMPNEEEMDKERQLDFAARATLSSVYTGKEIKLFVKPYRDMRGFSDLFNEHEIGDLTIIGVENSNSVSHVRYAGFLPRREMYEELLRHHIGLLPWRSHWFHRYCNPNKTYEYAHSGLFVILTDDFADVISLLEGNCATFSNYEELVEKLAYFKDHIDELNGLRQKTLDFARKNLFWEKYEHNIVEAYKLA